MNSKAKKILIICASLVLAIFIYRALFIKTVTYTIGGIDIPAKYNVLTRKATPIENYKGKMPKQIVIDRTSNNLGLDAQNVTAAQFRWALFEEWAKGKPEYKGWESDSEIFRKANEEFQKKIPAHVQVIK